MRPVRCEGDVLGLLWLIPVLPFAGFLVLALIGPRLSRTGVASIGAGSIALSTLVALLVSSSFIASPPVEHAYAQTLWTWMQVGGFTPGITLYLDALSLIMILVVTFVSLLIHLYSTEFMRDDMAQNDGLREPIVVRQFLYAVVEDEGSVSLESYTAIAGW